MADRIAINFSASIDEFISGSERITGELEEIRTELKKTADDSVTTYAEMTDAQKKAYLEGVDNANEKTRKLNKLVLEEVAAQEDAFEEFKRITRAGGRDIVREAENTAEGVAETYEEGFEKSADSADKLTDAASNVGDALGDLGGAAKDALEGDLAGAAGSAVDSLAGLAATAGGLAGVAVAGVLEVGKGILDIVVADAEAAEERVQTAFEAMIAAGSAAFEETQIMSNVADIIEDTQRNLDLKQQAADLGIAYGVVLRAEAGDQEALTAVIDRVNEKRAEAASKVAEYAAENKGALDSTSTAELANLQRLDDAWQAHADELNQSVSMYGDYTLAVNAGTTGTNELAAAINAVPLQKNVGLTVDTAGAEAALRNFTGLSREVRLDVVGYTQYGQKVI